MNQRRETHVLVETARRDRPRTNTWIQVHSDAFGEVEVEEADACSAPDEHGGRRARCGWQALALREPQTGRAQSVLVDVHRESIYVAIYRSLAYIKQYYGQPSPQPAPSTARQTLVVGGVNVGYYKCVSIGAERYRAFYHHLVANGETRTLPTWDSLDPAA